MANKPTDRAHDKQQLSKPVLDGLLKTRPHRQRTIWDTEETGLCVLISRGPKDEKKATVTFRVVYYLKDRPGKPLYKKLGRYPNECSDLTAVRDAARLVRIDAKKGIDPKNPKLTGNFKEWVGHFINDHSKNRTVKEAERIFNLYVVPEWGDKNIESITKSDVSELLSRIVNRKIKVNGKKLGTPAVARSTRSQLMTLFNWYVDKHGSNEFRSPIVISRKNKEWRPDDRTRVLDDDEIRALWMACGEGEMGTYGAAVKTALLTAQRFYKVGEMRRGDLKDRIRIQGHMEDGGWVNDQDIGNCWDATREDDPKNKRVSVVPLPPLAREVIASVSIIDGDKSKDFVFSLNGLGPIQNWSSPKAKLDRRMLAIMREQDPNAELKPWQHRDLRRTARTLMSRMKIDSNISEKCLGHIPPGVEKIYDRYSYLPEKREAFEKLSEMIERIINPPQDTVIPLRRLENSLTTSKVQP
jgi:integrase